MNTNAQQLLDHFDRLPQEDQREVAREILRRTADFDAPPLSDEELVRQADDLFLKLDQAEAGDAQGS